MPESPHHEHPPLSVLGADDHRLACHCLGVFTVAVGDQPLTGFRSERVRCLLAYLIVEANQTHGRNILAGLLWPDESETTARHNLRQSLYQLNQSLGSAISQQLLRVTRDTVTFVRHHTLRYDIGEFQIHLEQGNLAEALALYQGEFLSTLALSSPSERFSEWLSHHRSVLHRQACEAASTLAQRAIAERVSPSALAYAQRHLELDPLADVAHRHMIQAHLVAGNLSAAVAHYRSYENQLNEELGIAPKADLRALLPTRLPSNPSPQTNPTSKALTRTRTKAKTKTTAQFNLLEMPPPQAIYGRDAALQQLRHWLSDAGCRLIAITGLGGIGKTALTANLVHDLAGQYEAVIWRSLANAPHLTSVMQDWLAQIEPESAAATTPDADVLWRALLNALRQKRCLLILDNVESIFESGSDRHGYRSGYSDYGMFFQRIAESAHHSQLLLTSRELPYEIVRIAATGPAADPQPGSGHAARVLPLKGLDTGAVQQLLSAHRLSTTTATCESMAEAYSGNPLAIKLVSHVIQMLYSGNTEAFLQDGHRPGVIDDVRRLIDSQFERLAPLERQVFFWLTVARAPVSLDGLWADFWPPVSKRELVDALLSLERRSLLDRDENTSLLYLPNVVLEYGSDLFVERATQAALATSFDAEQPSLLHTHAWLKAQAADHIRDSQMRLIVQPIAQRLLARLGHAGLDAWVRARLDALRQSPMAAQSYAAGNFINLLVCAEIDLRGLDCSHLSVRQAYLPRTLLKQVDFSNAALLQGVFRQDFTVIKSLAFDPSGRRLAMATSNGLVRMWNLQQDQLDWSSKLHSAFVWGLAFSAAGRWLITGGNDGRICRVDAETGAQLRQLHTHPGEICGVAIRRDDQVIYSVCTNGVLRAADSDGNILWAQQDPHNIDRLALSPDDKWLATSSDSGAIYLWEADSGRLDRILHGHTARSKGLDFSPDGGYLASASNDYTVRLWNLAEGQTQHIFAGHTAWVWAVKFSPDGQLLASSGDDHTIRIWQTHTGTCVRVIRGHTHWVRPLAFHPTEAHLASAADDQTVRLWNLQTGKPEWVQQGYTNWIRALRFNPIDHTLAVGTADHTVRIWDVSQEKALKQLNGHGNVVTALAYSRDGRVLVSGSVDNNAQAWQIDAADKTASLESPRVLSGHAAQLYAVAANGDGSLIATASADHSVRLWHRPSGRELGKLPHSGKVYAIAFSDDDTSVIAATSSMALYVWDVPSQQLRHRWLAHRDSVYAVAISPDGRVIASGGADHRIHLWDMQTQRVLTTLEGHTGTIFTLAFSPDGRQLASGGYDRSVQLWDVATGRHIRTVAADASFIRAVAFSSDGHWLASGGADEWVRVWETSTFELIHQFKPEPPYAGLKLAATTGLTAAQRQALKSLGALD